MPDFGERQRRAVARLVDEFGSEEPVRALVDTWLGELPGRLAAIDAAATSPREAERAAHQLAGSSGLLGSTEVERLARTAERHVLDAGSSDGWRALVDELRDAASTAARILRDLQRGASVDEDERLSVLRSLDVLDTEAEAGFDELARLASLICGTPIALVSLVDEDRQWFKSRIGLEPEQTSREVSFCAHALDGGDLLIVEDALEDDRFSTNELVTGEPNVRFYAGAPLVVAGATLGTLCVIDRTPRQLDDHQLEALQLLAHQVVAQLELRRLMRTVSEQNRDLRELDRAKDAFLANVSHELRTPLASIMGYVELLADEHVGPLTADQRDLVQRVDVSSRRLDDQMSHLLSMSTAQRGQVVLEVEPLSLTELVEAAAAEARATAPDRSIEVRSDVGDVVLTGDRARLMQVLRNLLSNALKFSPADTPVAIELQLRGDEVSTTVRNEGAGMHPSEQARAFERFYRAPTAELDAVPGTGIGLAIARELVEAHGGRIRVSSAPGRGAAFTVDLPVGRGAVE